MNDISHFIKPIGKVHFRYNDRKRSAEEFIFYTRDIQSHHITRRAGKIRSVRFNTQYGKICTFVQGQEWRDDTVLQLPSNKRQQKMKSHFKHDGNKVEPKD